LGTNILETILIWVLGAFLAGHICKFFSVPVIIGFIVSGYLFKSFGLGDQQNFLSLPAELGVELLLFSIGLKIKPSSLLNRSLFIVFLIHTSTVLLIFFFLLILNLPLQSKILICLALTFSSTIIASKALEGRKEATTFHGRLALVVLVFQDILALALLIYTSDNNWNASALYLLFLPIAVPLIKLSFEIMETSDELELLATILIALLLGATLFKSVGLTGEIGALTVGMLLANYKIADRLSSQIWSVRELLLLAFFIALGMSLEINFDIILYSLFVVSFLFIKTLILFALLLAFKLRAYTSFLIVISLATYSEFSIILISDFLKSGMLSQREYSILIFSVCLSFIIGSILNKNVHRIYEFLEPWLVNFERSKRHPDEQPHTCGGADVMILGMGRVGQPIFENLAQNDIKVVGFDADTNRVKKHLEEGRRVTYADAEDPGFWSAFRFGNLNAIVLALPEYNAQKWSAQQARKFGFNGKIIVPTRSQGDPDILRTSGADEIYDAYQAAGIGVTKIYMKD
jgi:predicted Kef-type K+ transport protein|tara:strand:- start:650 stop:2203 length:1554 start_codon:yes stop_codon:yes gene_type:complete